MAHASTREKGILQMKKVRKARAKKKLEEAKLRNTLSEDEFLDLKRKRSERTLKNKTQTAIWDYEHKQFPIHNYDSLEKMLQDRLEEIKRTQEQNCENEIKKIEVVLNGLRS